MGQWIVDLGTYLLGVVQQWLVGFLGGIVGAILGVVEKRRPISWKGFTYFLLGFLVLSPFQLWREQRAAIKNDESLLTEARLARDSCVGDKDRAIAAAREAASTGRIERFRAYRDHLGTFLIECDQLLERCAHGPTTPIEESLRWVKHVESYLSSSGLDRTFLARFKGAQEPSSMSLPLGQVAGDVEEMLRARRRVLVKLIEELGSS